MVIIFNETVFSTAATTWPVQLLISQMHQAREKWKMDGYPKSGGAA
jgi:hypothetical protein